MLSIHCPRCSLPRDSADAGEKACPLCGWDPKDPHEAAPVEENFLERQEAQALVVPEPTPEKRGGKRGLVMLALVLVLAAGGTGVLGYAWTQRSKAKPSSDLAQVQAEEYKKESQPASKPKPKKDAPRPKPPELLRVEPDPPPHPVVENPPMEGLPKLGEVAVQGDAELINMPGQEYIIDTVRGDTKRILRGIVGTLCISSVQGKAVIDASELEAEKIIVNGIVNEQGTLKLHSTQGVIDFRGKVDGFGVVEISASKGKVLFSQETRPGEVGSQINGTGHVTITCPEVEMHGKIDGKAELNINAEGGRVLFTLSERSEEGGARITGASKVTINAKELALLARVDGGCEVTATLSPGGKLRYHLLDGGARLRYRKSNPGDPEPTIEAGAIKGGAKMEALPNNTR